jgi:hypothetical protein
MLSSISSSICENATRLHRLDLDRLGRRAETACQFQDRLTDLKDRIARMAAVRPRSADADRGFGCNVVRISGLTERLSVESVGR